MSNYGADAAFKTYCDERGVSYAGKTDNEITQALIRSSAYIDATYLALFQGERVGGRSQALQWPRVGVVDMEGWSVPSTEVPSEIINASYEGAIRELAAPGSLNPDVSAGGGVIKRVKAGSVEVEYASNASTTATFQRIADVLAPLLGRASMYTGFAARV